MVEGEKNSCLQKLLFVLHCVFCFLHVKCVFQTSTAKSFDSLAKCRFVPSGSALKKHFFLTNASAPCILSEQMTPNVCFFYVSCGCWPWFCSLLCHTSRSWRRQNPRKVCRTSACVRDPTSSWLHKGKPTKNNLLLMYEQLMYVKNVTSQMKLLNQQTRPIFWGVEDPVDCAEETFHWWHFWLWLWLMLGRGEKN